MYVPVELETATGTAGALLSLGIVGCSLARPRYGAAFALCNRFRITSLVDQDTKYARAWGRTLGSEIDLHADLKGLLSSNAVPDALIIDVPLAERAETILEAIPHCRALLCAPPFASTLEETDKILHAAAAHGRSPLLDPP